MRFGEHLYRRQRSWPQIAASIDVRHRPVASAETRLAWEECQRCRDDATWTSRLMQDNRSGWPTYVRMRGGITVVELIYLSMPLDWILIDFTVAHNPLHDGRIPVLLLSLLLLLFLLWALLFVSSSRISNFAHSAPACKFKQEKTHFLLWRHCWSKQSCWRYQGFLTLCRALFTSGASN